MTIAGSATEWKRPLPVPSPLTAPFWQAAKEGRLVLQRCTTCGEYVWTPQLACRTCLTETLVWTPVSGRGSIYTFVVIHRAATPAFRAPYAIVVIRLEEGPYMLSDMVDVDPAAVRIGMSVEVTFEDVGPVSLYHFRPQR
jgi:hypothetical protein